MYTVHVHVHYCTMYGTGTCTCALYIVQLFMNIYTNVGNVGFSQSCFSLWQKAKRPLFTAKRVSSLLCHWEKRKRPLVDHYDDMMMMMMMMLLYTL